MLYQSKKTFSWYSLLLQANGSIILLDFIEYYAHTSIVRTWISQWFLAKKILFFKINFTRINHCKFNHHKSHLKPFLSYLPHIVRREYFSIIFHVKKCTLYSLNTVRMSCWTKSCLISVPPTTQWRSRTWLSRSWADPSRMSPTQREHTESLNWWSWSTTKM